MAVARKSTICLVDLAGSERVNKTGATGHQLKEAQSINLSLMTLGRVITQLAKGGQGVPPYRESKLTLLCKDFLGGNAKTFVLATVSPSVSERGETLGTLGYANQAKNIVTKAQVRAWLTDLQYLLCWVVSLPSGPASRATNQKCRMAAPPYTPCR